MENGCCFTWMKLYTSIEMCDGSIVQAGSKQPANSHRFFVPFLFVMAAAARQSLAGLSTSSASGHRKRTARQFAVGGVPVVRRKMHSPESRARSHELEPDLCPSIVGLPEITHRADLFIACRRVDDRYLFSSFYGRGKVDHATMRAHGRRYRFFLKNFAFAFPANGHWHRNLHAPGPSLVCQTVPRAPWRRIRIRHRSLLGIPF